MSKLWQQCITIIHFFKQKISSKINRADKVNMSQQTKYKLGILAFGSLIDNPGQEISEFEIERIECETPFKIEFARTSSTRGNAPTLIPVDKGGRFVKALIIILRNDVSVETAKSALWRRETHRKNGTETYAHSENPTPNKVVVKLLYNFMNVETVLYTSIGSNINQKLTGELLADFAIASIMTKAGQEEKDGLRYLLSAKRNNIVTELSADYESQILAKTNTTALEQAIEILDRKRMMYPSIKLTE